MFFNKDVSFEHVVTQIAERFAIAEEQSKTDCFEFLKSIGDELSPSRFSVVEQEDTSVPWGVELQITGECNLRCRHCLQQGYAGQMKTTTALQIIDSLASAGVFEISILGGEPFKHPGIFPIIERCVHHELAINVVTNGLLLAGEGLDKIANVPRLALFVSIDGLEDDHDFIRGKGTFRQVESIVDLLLKKGVNLEILCTLNSRNMIHYRQVLEYANGLGISCDFNLFKPFRKDQEYLIPDPRQFFQAMCELFELRQSGTHMVGIANAAIVSRLLGINTKNECRATQSGLVINSEGRMVTCPSLEEAGYYQVDELPLFDEDWLMKWQTHPSFLQFKRNGLSNCQAREYVFKKIFNCDDPFSLEEFDRYVSGR